MTTQNIESHPEPSDRKCVGSFIAFTRDKTRHVLEIWAYRDAIHYGYLKRISPAELFLMTSDGQAVDRIEQGEYRLRDFPQTTFTTDDLEAP